MAYRGALSRVSLSEDNARAGRKSMGGPIKRQSRGGRNSLAPQSKRESLAGPKASSRKSMAGRPSTGGRPSTAGRYSMGGRQSMGGANSRRSSMHRRPEPRPLSDKGYKQQSIKELMEFLVYNQFPKAISEQRLKGPSTREFVEIFQFVYERLDPCFPWAKLKAEDEIPTLLKAIGYPFSVKPSLIISCGSPHNWPKLLGALRWMIELTDFLEDHKDNILRLLISQAQLLSADREGDFFGTADSEEMLETLQFILETAETFRQHGEDGMLPSLEPEAVEEKRMQVIEEREALKAESEQLRAQRDELESASSRLPKLRQKKAEVESDCEQLTQELAKGRQSEERYDKRIAELQQFLEARKEELANVQARKRKLQETCDAQDMQREQFEQVQTELARLKTDLKSTRFQIRQRKDDVKAKQDAVAQKEQQLIELLNDYNHLVCELGLTSANANNPVSRDCRLRVQTTADSVDEILSANVKRDIAPAIQEFRGQVQQSLQQAGLEQQHVARQLAEVQQQIDAKREEIGSLEQRIQATMKHCSNEEELLREERQRHESSLKSEQGEASRLREEVDTLRHQSQVQLEHAMRRYQELKESCAREEERLNKVIFEALTAVVHYKEYVTNVLAQMQARYCQ
ncbi:hypothetical protein PTSG_00214 [Salpingoeca rosetta]|uniref:Kinetochore protein NDC80 n=1 Tax=Salpingoeca rosetta (strain ATCC 50818 / BSB-021) TaxID=946362 RepID=F2TVU6_SALR5|nr:uncharacterized protein PTSG_00214 [Salpingoeca rosetta]EGD72192.1 hypothetical protein PTSG_00214 [Salpingoeca rosetta]|eukprot:XP_004998763.1 hypothetical protein PTSG_00214 [Salpingoeca rosetta]